MPKYEFKCTDCRRKFEVFFTFSEYGTKEVVCPFCRSKNVQRKIGRIRIGRSDESRLENMSDPSRLAGLDDDPRSLGKMMREMSKETGEDLGPEFSEVVNRLESGQSPDQIEKDLPDLAAGMDGGGMDSGGMDAGLGDDL